MSDNSFHITEYIKQGVFAIIIIAIALFGIKSCRKFQKKRQVVIELSNLAGPSAAYEQFYKENAQQNLLKAMYQIHLGTELGETPNEIIAKVMEQKKELFTSNNDDDLPIRKTLIRDALLSNYDNCIKLGIFEDPNNIDALSKGEFPTITTGPTEGELVVVRPIIASSILPGVDKLLPNMILSPPLKGSKQAKETLFERARAKQLVKALSSAELIDRTDYQKVLDHYEKTLKVESSQ